MAKENNNKIPCGGFCLGDGLTMDGNTLKSLGGEQVQTDWNQNDATAKDYIKNRPGGYAVTPSLVITWDGDTTGKETIDLGVGFTMVKIADEAPPIEKFAAKSDVATFKTVSGPTENALRTGRFCDM